MDKKVYKITSLLALLVTIISFLFNYKFALGVLLGFGFSMLYLYVLELSYRNLDSDYEVNFFHYLLVFIRFILLALPMLIACLLPNVFNVIGSFIGLILFKLSLLIIAKKGV